MKRRDDIFYKICFDSLLEGICITDKDGRIVMINTAIEEIFGYNKEELIAKRIDVLIPANYRKIHSKHFESYLKSPKKYKKGKGREFLGLHKNGDILDLEIGLNYFDFEGEFFAKALISEISTRKQKELEIQEKNKDLELLVEQRTAELTKAVAELEKSNHHLKLEIKDREVAQKRAKIAFEKEKELNLMQTKFISLASHEFKTPLSGILTSASLIEKYNGNEIHEKINHHVSTIKTLVNQLNNLLDDFLFLENTESENYVMNLTRFKFCELVKVLVHEAKAILKEGQEIEFTSCKVPVEVWQDRKVIDIIIKNVLYNAIKYSPERSKIKMTIERNESLKIIIEDQGIGIPESDQKHIFERFYRAQNALTIQGTGIGLNIAKRYLEKLNGSISIESKEHRGTKVVLKLPIDYHKKAKSMI